jgi:NAD kinase
MQFFVSAADPAVADRYARRLRDAGVDVAEEYDREAVVLSVGGDGAILYNAREYGDPTILPVARPGSEGNRIEIREGEAVERVRAVAAGREGEDYRVETHHKLGAYRDGTPLDGGFEGMNDVHLHHRSPVRAAKFRTRIRDDGVVYRTDRAIGDGLLVATPFGSTAYYRSLTGGTFDRGIGVAFNNRHKPADAPDYLVGSGSAVVEVELREASRGPNAALYRDDDPEPYPLSPGERVSVRRSGTTVDVVHPLSRE